MSEEAAQKQPLVRGSATNTAPEQVARQRRTLAEAFAAWRSRLLDLTKRNRALSYRPSKVSTVTVVDEKPTEIYRLLVGEEKALAFAPTLPSASPERVVSRESPRDATSPAKQPLFAGEVGETETPPVAGPSNDIEADLASFAPQPFAPYDATGVAERHRDLILQCLATPESLDLSLRRLADQQRSGLEEQGVNTLFLALGFLHYKEIPTAETTLRAPLVLVPVSLQRANAKTAYRVVSGDDEPIVNPTLVEYLRQFHNFTSFPLIPEPAEDPKSFDLQPFFSAVAALVAPLQGWRVTEEIALAPFAFQKLVIYKDLEQREAEFNVHPLVRRVVLHEDEPAHDLPEEIREMELDAEYPPEVANVVLDADSSQLRAMAAVERGHDLVIHGPPGTGKSQTIANLIANALASGKRVLFVSEKMAALEVVHRRLAQAKLGEFCLELHSTKSRKGDVIESLRSALNASGAPTKGVVQSVKELSTVRERLNTYAKELHTKRTALGCCVFEALGRFASVVEAPRFNFTGNTESMSPEEVAGLEERLRLVEVQGGVLEPISECGWRDARLTEFSESIAVSIERNVREGSELCDAFLHTGKLFAEEFGFREPTTLDSTAGGLKLAAHVSRSPGSPAAMLREPGYGLAVKHAQELVANGRQLSATEAHLQLNYKREELNSFDPEEVEYVEAKSTGPFAFLSVLNGRFRALRRKLREMRRAGCQLSVTEQLADLKKFPHWRAECERLARHPKAAGWFGVAWRGTASDWSDLERRLVWLQEFHMLLTTCGPMAETGYRLAEIGSGSEKLVAEMHSIVERLRDRLKTISILTKWPQEYLLQENISCVAKRLGGLLRDLPLGPAWVALVRAVKELEGTPADEIAAAAFSGTLKTTDVCRTFRRSLYGAWLDRVIPSVPALGAFTGQSHDEFSRRFRRLDSELRFQKQTELVSRLRETAQSRFANSPAPQRLFLTRELAKQKRHRPLRVTMREAHEALTALKPCFLMSPLSVSQFLPAGGSFDLVIFDEASQLPTEDAVAAICRGKHLVVVGDPKQLPPTNFFAVQTGARTTDVDDAGDPVLEETESVLEEFQAVGLPQAHLEWHYRSAHPSLIQFSNEKFYENRLVVFPSTAIDIPHEGIKFEYVPDGIYGGAGLNQVEARRVAEAVVLHFKNRPNETLGVGTFSQRQQMAIWDELERFRREDVSLESFFDRAIAEPFFVKNLENIQGDERDAIFLSVTYGRQNDGRLRYNFGPLNRENGWRRLNVLVSRARRSMRVFSSLRAADINPSSVTSDGPMLLADFLRFAETGKLMATGSTHADADSPFEFEVGEAIKQMGYLVDRQVGVSAYSIDLGVRHADRPGAYLAGVECDGAAYHAAPCARDRDRLRQYVLEERGWTIVRVWSTDWFKDRRGTLERLERALLAAAEQSKDTESSETAVPECRVAGESSLEPDGAGLRLVGFDREPPSERKPSYTRPAASPYSKCLSRSTRPGTLADASPAQLARAVEEIVVKEGPLHSDDVVDRLLEFWNHTRRGIRIVTVAESGIRMAVELGLVVASDGFLAKEGTLPRPRNREGMNQGAERVALEELCAAAQLILGLAGVMREDELAAELREMLGLRRTDAGRGRIGVAIQQLIQTGKVIYGLTGLQLRDAPSGAVG